MSDQRKNSAITKRAKKKPAEEISPDAEKAEYQKRNTPVPADGQISEFRDGPVPGALEAEGHRPVLERSRKVR